MRFPLWFTMEDVFHEGESSFLVLVEWKSSEQALNNEQLAKLIGEKEALIQELEIRVERVQTELKTSTGAHQTAEERQRLLQAMQNDKVLFVGLLRPPFQKFVYRR